MLCVIGAVAGPPQESPKYVAIILHCLALALFKISTCPDQLEENVAKIVKQVLSGGSPDTVDLCNFSIHVERTQKRTSNPHPI